MYRIMIVDDEEVIREGVAHLIKSRCPRWEVVATARDGLEAIENAQQLLPHVVLTDITMPHMNGLDFMESLMGLLPEVRTLVLSGYDQFEYAVQALRLGVEDYLLKPLESDKLLKLLDKIADELDAQSKHMEDVQHLHNEILKVHWMELKTYFRALIRGVQPPSLAKRVEEYAKGNAFCCVLCNGIAGQTDQLDAMLAQRIPEKENIRKVLLQVEAPAELAIIFWSSEDESTDFFLTLNHMLASVAVECKRTLERDVRFFIGQITETPQKLKHSYRRALQARNYAFPEDTAPVTSYEDVLESSLMPFLPMPEQLQKDIPAMVTCGNQVAFHQSCQDLFDWFRKENIRDATYMRMCVLSLFYAIIHSSREVGMVSFYEFTNFQSEVMNAQSLEELQTLLESFARLRWLRQQEAPVPRRPLGERVGEIVRMHLSNMEFSLDDVASSLYISPNYLRQLFKQETGMTFTEYLTAQRMQHAKLLLGNPRMRVSDVAEQCGYADSRYFSVCFKKYWHMTPSEYQATLLEQMR